MCPLGDTQRIATWPWTLAVVFCFYTYTSQILKGNEFSSSKNTKQKYNYVH